MEITPRMATASPAPTRHRATWLDRLAVILLGVAGCALSYDALRQMATAVHVRHQLTYLFPVVIDGFIAYGVRALLVLREAPPAARLYAWTLFIAATAASIWANGLHALDLNQPGVVALHLDDATVAVLSAIAPLALAGATHLHILITRYGGTPTPNPAGAASATPGGIQDGTQPVPEQPPAVPYTALTRLPSAEPPQAQVPATIPSPADTAASPAPGDETEPRADSGVDDEADDDAEASVPGPDFAGQESEEEAGPGAATKAGGRPAMASITELADIISAAHPDGSGLTRDSARKAISDAGLGAATVRIAEAMAFARQRTQALQHRGD